MRTLFLFLLLVCSLALTTQAQVPNGVVKTIESAKAQTQSKVAPQWQISRKWQAASWIVFGVGSGLDHYTSTKFQPPYTIELNPLFRNKDGSLNQTRDVAGIAIQAAATWLVDRRWPKMGTALRFMIGGVRLTVAIHNHRLTQKYNPHNAGSGN